MSRGQNGPITLPIKCDMSYLCSNLSSYSIILKLLVLSFSFGLQKVRKTKLSLPQMKNYQNSLGFDKK